MQRGLHNISKLFTKNKESINNYMGQGPKIKVGQWPEKNLLSMNQILVNHLISFQKVKHSWKIIVSSEKSSYLKLLSRQFTCMWFIAFVPYNLVFGTEIKQVSWPASVMLHADLTIY